MPGPWEQDILQRLERLERKYKCVACCDDEFGLTALAPPVDAPGANDPNVLFNPETNQMWFWGGAAWVEFSPQISEVYAAYIIQADVEEPSPTVQYNSTGEVPVWGRMDIGRYSLTFSSTLLTAGTHVQATLDDVSAAIAIKVSVVSTEAIEVFTYDDAGALIDLAGGAFIHIKIYS